MKSQYRIGDYLFLVGPEGPRISLQKRIASEIHEEFVYVTREEAQKLVTLHKEELRAAGCQELLGPDIVTMWWYDLSSGAWKDNDMTLDTPQFILGEEGEEWFVVRLVKEPFQAYFCTLGDESYQFVVARGCPGVGLHEFYARLIEHGAEPDVKRCLEVISHLGPFFSHFTENRAATFWDAFKERIGHSCSLIPLHPEHFESLGMKVMQFDFYYAYGGEAICYLEGILTALDDPTHMYVIPIKGTAFSGPFPFL